MEDEGSRPVSGVITTIQPDRRVRQIFQINTNQVEYNENIAVSDMAEYIRTYAEEKYDMIIVHGSQFKASAEEMVVYPDSHFCLSLIPRR